MIEPVKKALLRVERDQAVAGVRTMEEVVSGSVASRRFPMLLPVASRRWLSCWPRSASPAS